MSSSRSAVLDELVQLLRTVRPGRRALVAIDGVDGAGKSSLAAELVDRARADGGRPFSSVSIDGFHHPRDRRYARGRGPETFYRDSYDYPAFARSVIAPFRAGSPVVPAVWDVDADAPVHPSALDLPVDCVLLVDGIFLHRPELRDQWDASFWLEVPFAVSVPRGNARFPGSSAADPEDASNRRYVDGQRLYLTESTPEKRATWILDNTDLDHPSVTPGAPWHD